MTNQEKRPMDPADLRQKAEALSGERAVRMSEESAALSPGEIRKMQQFGEQKNTVKSAFHASNIFFFTS